MTDVRIEYLYTAAERRTGITPCTVIEVQKVGKSPRSDEFALEVHRAAQTNASDVAGRKSAGMYAWKVV